MLTLIVCMYDSKGITHDVIGLALVLDAVILLRAAKLILALRK